MINNGYVQKRKMRTEKKNNNQVEKLTKVGINWLITIYLTPLRNPLFTMLCGN